MTERSVTHAKFVVERTYDASPARVFAAWADPAAKARWFGQPDEFDFTVGGREINRGGPEGGHSQAVDAPHNEEIHRARGGGPNIVV